MKPAVFVGSSREGLPIARAIGTNLDYDAEVNVWIEAFFRPSQAVLDNLLEHLNACDFGIFVLSPDDALVIRDQQVLSARDNVIFELGMYMGKLGKQRSFFVVPAGQGDLHLPSDLAGIIPLTFDLDRFRRAPEPALAAACNVMRRVIEQLGIREGRGLEGRSFAARRAELGNRQNAILNEITAAVIQGREVNQDTLEQAFPDIGERELFYRLEHLRLLGFLTSQEHRVDEHNVQRYEYTLSRAYRSEIGNIPPPP